MLLDIEVQRETADLGRERHIKGPDGYDGLAGCISWLRHYATSRKVAGSRPVEVIGFFN
jgi:hypothetical protein